MIKTKIKPVRLKNILSNEIWICEDYTKTRTVDGVDFIQVHRESNVQATYWINKHSLAKTKN